MLKDLGYRNEDIRSKQSIEQITLSKKGGRKKEPYKPDFVLVVRDAPRIVIDAKATDEEVDTFEYQIRAYCLSLNSKFKGEKPVQQCILCNGRITKIYKWDEETPLLTLDFDAYSEGNPKYQALRQLLAKDSILQTIKIEPVAIELFEYGRPELDELEGIFTACHNLIWKKESIPPAEAFYKFAKIMFVKLNQDKRLRADKHLKQLIVAKQPLPVDEVVFSTRWIEKRKKEGVKNPVDSILFNNLRQEFETDVKRGLKKRIFEAEERITLEKPSTIDDVARLLEHHDLHGIDEDVNGRLFENFLEATVRGKSLGQYFTPRAVVEFMTKMANLRVDFEKSSFDRTLDACCGTGGFLIEAMDVLRYKIDQNQSLSQDQKDELQRKLTQDFLFGIDTSKGIARIARINMYLHGDGGSRIYEADALDKEVRIEKGIEEERKFELEELRHLLLDQKTKFDVVLTNPPFAMRKERDKPDEKEILDQYTLATDEDGAPRASLKSSVMFLERYCELLNDYGKLLTVMDESVLNTSSNKPIRDFIKKHYLIKAVISLPQNAFVNAGSGVKTSILYLVKKKQESEQQPQTFMAICGNIGHLDSGRRARHLNELPSILEEFRRYETGEIK
jgi:type I restriction enzyme M protein